MAVEILAIDVAVADGVAQVTLRGELDTASAPKLRARLIDLASEEHQLIRIDLSGVDFIDSTGLGVLIGGAKRQREGGGGFVLVRPSPRVKKVLDITGLTKVFLVSD